MGLFPFYVGKKAIPSAGQVVIRVGRLGVYTSVVARDGSPLGDAVPNIPLLANGQADLDGVDQRLDALSTQHPLIRAANLHVDREFSLLPLLELMHRVVHGPNKERFTALRIIVQ